MSDAMCSNGNDGKIQAKAGRPPILSDASLDALHSLYPDIRSRRGLLNKYYQIRAFGALKDLPGTTFLVDRERGQSKWLILEQLGRLPNEAEIKSVASYLCQRARTESMTVKEWERLCILIRHSGELISEAASETTEGNSQEEAKP